MMYLKRSMKRVRPGLYEIAAFCIIAGATIMRLVLIANNWPNSNSDEGTMGLEAINIAFHGAHPIFFYGQDYMGVLQAYLGALFFHLFGVSTFSLRLGMVLLFTLFLIVMYFLVSLLYTKALAIISLILLSLGSEITIVRELLAVGGIGETLFFGSLSLLLACWLAFTANEAQRKQQGWKRLLLYSSWGIVVGLGLWSHLIVVPFVLGSGLIILAFCWREWRGLSIPVIILSLAIGGLPLIIYNLRAPLSKNSLAIALSIQGGSDPGSGVLVHNSVLLQHLVGTFLYALPIATGLSPTCSLTVLPFYGTVGPQTLTCSITQGSWSLVYLLLLSISAILALVALGRLWSKYRSHRAEWSEGQRRQAVLHFSRFLLVFCGLLTIFIFFHSALAAAKPDSTRYLAGLAIVLPAVIWPLWQNSVQHLRLPDPAIWGTILRYSVLLFAFVIIFTSTWTIIHRIPSVQANFAHDQTLLHDLEQHGITRFYSEYWTCNRLMFESQQGIVCADVSTNFSSQQALNRISSAVTVLKGVPKPTYVFPVGPYSRAADRSAKLRHHYRRFMLDGFVVYQYTS
jgi:4-amino-4-deoxy-L-arabinose transferase-like glycosyltransferase